MLEFEKFYDGLTLDVWLREELISKIEDIWWWEGLCSNLPWI